MRPFEDPGPPADRPRHASESTGRAAPAGLPGHLPAELNRFVGRCAEAAELVGLLAAGRLVTVTGVGGVGKSRLALHTARRLQDRFCDGVWLAELAALRDGRLLDHTVAEALGLAGSSVRPPRSAMLRQLAEREALLVLDGCEHLVEESAELVDALLRHAPGLRVLVTGRRPLEIAGEHVFVLPPLPVGEAVELFAERARAVLAGPPGPGEAVVEVCRRLDGIPLAVELAAGRLRVLSVEQIAHRIGDRFRLLASSSRSALPRHQTLRTAVGWSHELCTAQERLLWARLSVFAGDFDLEAVEYLCSDEDLPADRVLSVLDELVAQSVVVREGAVGAEGQARYRLLETVREYGAGWLAELGETEDLRRRHRDWYLGLATWCELDWFGPRQAEVAGRVEQELPNLRLALEYSLGDPEDAHLGQYLAATLWFYWIGCGRLAEGQHWLDQALAWEGGHAQTRAKALWVSGLASLVRGQVVGALGALHECLELSEAEGDSTAHAYALQMLGCLAVVSDDLPRAKSLLCEALERFRELGELNALVILAQVELAMAHAFDGELETALTLCEEARQLSADSGERWVLSYALYLLAYVHMVRDDAARARELSVQCLTIKREFHDVLGMTIALEHLAPLTAAEDPERSAAMLGAADAGWRVVGARRFGSRHFENIPAACRAHLLASLGERVYEAAYARGRKRGLLAAVDEAVRRASGGPAGPARAVAGSGRTAHGSTGRLPEREDAPGTAQPAVPPPTGRRQAG
ncbi:ATP-binding protein [Streptomyces boncukensis]|uniref:AAA family ATPase n=1 Tax=Streptomyces boncukensis TaxID=2711219 RepID=A0A6G4WW31_9ACTN|nr:AAA family ATPase [Streptomyces boncukensis]NGO69213.1 AAA family ATPase [Streptomyces boncukensis]